MTKLPPLKAREVVKGLQAMGFWEGVGQESSPYPEAIYKAV